MKAERYRRERRHWTPGEQWANAIAWLVVFATVAAFGWRCFG